MSKIIGVTVGTTKPRANFGQTNPKKADYIKNRPTAKTEAMTQPVGVDENGDLWTVPGGVGGITKETDPTVPEWAKQPNKPTYTADEVNARSNTWMPTAEDVGARPSTWTPTASDVRADEIGTADSKVTDHNVAPGSHNDIRLLIQGLDARLTALADSDDTTLDQLSELVAYIKANRGLIESITTDKVNVTDIVDNLTTNATDKPLSAAQGVALKALIDALTTTVDGKMTSAQVTSAINSALSSYLTTAKAAELYQPKGDYAAAGHNHDGVYQPAGNYAAADHNHDALYQPKGDYLTQHQSLDHLVKIDQGTSNAGKILMVGADGKIIVTDMPATGDIIGSVDGSTILLDGDLDPGDYTFAYLVRKDDGTTETVTIGTYTVEDESETKTYTVTFVADGATVEVVEYEYEDGATSITEPAVPEKDGYTGAWEPYDISNGGNITVNAVYTKIEDEPSYTNLADPSDPYWKEGYRLSISGGGTVACDGMTSTNFIPAKKGDTLYVKGLDITKNVNGQQSKIVKYTAADESKVSGGAFGTTSNAADQYGSKLVKSGDVQSLVLLECNDGQNTMTDNIKYIRLDGALMDGYTSSDVIITINEPIE